MSPVVATILAIIVIGFVLFVDRADAAPPEEEATSPLQQPAEEAFRNWLGHPNEYGDAAAGFVLTTVYSKTETEWPFIDGATDVHLIAYADQDCRKGIGVSSAGAPDIAFSFVPALDPEKDWTDLPPEDLLLFYAGARMNVYLSAAGDIQKLDPADFMPQSSLEHDTTTKVFRIVSQDETVICGEYMDTFTQTIMGNCGALELDNAVSEPVNSAYHGLPFEYYYLGRRFYGLS